MHTGKANLKLEQILATGDFCSLADKAYSNMQEEANEKLSLNCYTSITLHIPKYYLE